MHFLVLLSALVACAAGVPLETAKPSVEGRIEGGNPTEIVHHPHQVALLYYGSFFCSGSIISPNWVVTTAHCVQWTKSNHLAVRAGSTHHDVGGTIHYVTGGYYHGSYNLNYYNDYDVAVLRVLPPFTYSDSVQEITLQDSEISPGTSLVVTGWGATSPEYPYSPSLHEAFVQITEHDKCNAAHYGWLTDRMVCTGTHSGFIGPCHGDGGGPLTTLHGPRRLVGIVSAGEWYCGLPGYPAVYTKVSAVRDWIINVSSVQPLPKGITKADAMP